MYYELYVDVLFLVNFMMDYLLLLLVWKMLKCTATHVSIFLGAMLGAFITCIVIILPLPNNLYEFILFHFAVNTCMIFVGLKIKDVRSYFKAFILLYIGAFFMGGIMTSLGQYVKAGSLFFAVAIGTYYLTCSALRFIEKMQKWNQYHCRVELYWKETKYEINGIIDTGNGLVDPVTNQPVSILDRETAMNIWGENNLHEVRFIPYQSIGKNAGVLPVLQIDRICVKGTEVHWVEKPLIAISEEKISQMILNPRLF